MPDIDSLSDSWRWWGSMGAFLAVWPVGWWIAGVVALMIADWRGPREQYVMPEDDLRFSDAARVILGIGLFMALLGVLIAGAIIPWANDHRLAGFTRESVWFQRGMGAAWLFWGSCAWISAIGFARRRWQMITACVLWWFAVWFALRETAGLML